MPDEQQQIGGPVRRHQNILLTRTDAVRCENSGSSRAPPIPTSTAHCGLMVNLAEPNATRASALAFGIAATSKIRVPIAIPPASRTRDDASTPPRSSSVLAWVPDVVLRTMKLRSSMSPRARVPGNRRLRDVNGCRPELHVAIRPAHNQRPDNAARELPFNRAAKQKVRLAGEGAGSAKGPRTRPAESTCAERPVDQPRALLTID